MSQTDCFSDYFILNSQLKPCVTFNTDWLYKGESVYEVFRIINGVPLFWPDHFQRLGQSMQLTGISLDISADELQELIRKLIKSGSKNGNIKLVINTSENNTNLIIYYVKHYYPTKEQYSKGVSVITHKAERKNPNAKQLNQTLRDTALQLIKQHEVFEVLLVDDQNCITEGSRSNVFMIRDGALLTPMIRDVLPGITREYVLKLCLNEGIPVKEAVFPVTDIPLLDALFITGTSPKILPVMQIDTHRFNFESLVLYKLMRLFDELIEKHILESRKFWV